MNDIILNFSEYVDYLLWGNTLTREERDEILKNGKFTGAIYTDYYIIKRDSVLIESILHKCPLDFISKKL